MSNCLILLATLLITSPDVLAANHEPGREVAENKKLLSTMARWLREYRKGKYDVGNSYVNIASKSLARKAGFAPKKLFDRDNNILKPGQFCYREEIQILIPKTADLNSVPAAQLLLELAAVGLDDHYKYKLEMVPHHIRHLAEENLSKFTTPESRDYFLAAAKGNPKGPKKILPALRAAAIKALASFGDKPYWPAIQEGLAAKENIVRSLAAEALGRLGAPEFLKPVVTALEKEASDVPQMIMFEAIMRIYNESRGIVDKALLGRAADTAMATLLRGNWPARHARVDYLARFPVKKEIVPVMIDILARHRDHPEEVVEGKLSGRLRHRAHAALTGFTGCYWGADEVDEWHSYWMKNKDSFKFQDGTKKPLLLKREWREKYKRKEPAKNEGAAGFFGIPVQGSKVVFILDHSFSLGEKMPVTTPEFESRWKKGLSRLKVEQEEVTKAIKALPPDTLFDVVSYEDRIRSALKKPLPASRKNKSAASRFAQKLRVVEASVNTCDGLFQALGIESLVYGASYASGVDEIFLVSGRVLNSGAIRDADILEMTIRETNRFSKVTIHTVFIGSIDDELDKSGVGKSLMKAIAEQNGGKFVRP